MAMVVLALDDDPVDGYPKCHARDDPLKIGEVFRRSGRV